MLPRDTKADVCASAFFYPQSYSSIKPSRARPCENGDGRGLQIERGQEVRLYLHAFPHMNYKIFSGTVIELPSRNQVAPPGAMPVNALTLYPVKIWIDEPFVRSGDQIYPVAYGMRLDAKIIIERNLIWKIAWKKIAEAFGIVDKQHPFVF